MLTVAALALAFASPRTLRTAPARQTPASQAQAAGNTYALVIGIDQYQDKSIAELSGADKDADRFASWLIQSGGITKDHVLEMTSKTPLKPNRDNLLGACGVVQSWQLRPSDTLLVFYAGHAVEVSGGSYLIPFDGRKTAKTLLGATLDQIGVAPGQTSPGQTAQAAGSVNGSAVTDPQQLNWLSCEAMLRALGQNAGTVIAFFDMCRGPAWDSGPQVNATLTTAIIQSSDPRNLPPEIAPGQIGILHASSRNQTSEEINGEGRMTAALIEALTTSAADANHDGKITYGELEDFVRNRVSKDTNDKQVPSTRDEGNVRDHVLGNVPKPAQKPAVPTTKGGKGNGTQNGTGSGSATNRGTKPSNPPATAATPTKTGTATPPQPIAAPAVDQKAFFSEGAYCVLPGPKWIDLTSGEGAFSARIPAQDVSDPRLVKRLENIVNTPDGDAHSRTYVYEQQDGYVYLRYSAAVIDYPIKVSENAATEHDLEAKVLDFGKKLVEDRGKAGSPLLAAFGDNPLAKTLALNLGKMAGKVDIGKLTEYAEKFSPNDLVDKIPVIGNFAAGILNGGKNNKKPSILQTGYIENIGQHPGYRIEWRKVNESFGILQLGVIRNRLYILSEVYAGGDGKLPLGVVPQLFVDSFKPADALLANPAMTISYVGGGN